jgi:predicted NBD/HSP70 family sugar kinase
VVRSERLGFAGPEHEAGAARGVDVRVTVGTGIGMGIVVDGALFRGAPGAAGEVGYLPYGWPPPRSPPRQGMLGSAAAAQPVDEFAAGQGLAVRTAKDVFRLAREGEPWALHAVAEEATRLAFVVASVGADPALVVLSGGIGKNTDVLSAPLEGALAHTTPLRPKIVPGELGEEAALTGAIATALCTARDVVFQRRGRVLLGPTAHADDAG